ncbi:hypothetical protein F0227_13865, partial [Vibrio sp. 99-8-1]|nr:hypothetical protein [Vibrio sp. 99-8-1]
MIKAYIIGAIVLLGLTLFFRYPTGPYIVDVGFTNGSTSGRHIVDTMLITTKAGGKANFAMGSVSGYPGKMSTGGRMSAPAYIEGY